MLKFLRGEASDERPVDDGVEASDEGSRLLHDLRIHSKVSHPMHIADPEKQSVVNSLSLSL